MQAVATQPRLSHRPIGIALIILTAIVLWWLFPGSLGTLALLATVALLLFGFRRPVWALAALLVGQLTITSYMVSTPIVPISLRLILALLTLALTWQMFGQARMDVGPRARQLVVPIAILMVVSLASNLLNSSFDFAFRDLRNMIVGLLIVLLVPAVVRNLRELKILSAVAFVAITASAAVGVMQHYGVLGMGEATIIPGFLGLTTEGQPRVPGMAMTELEFSYIVSAGVLAVAGMFLARGVGKGHRKLLFLSAALMMPALYFTYTRSALLAVALGLGALIVLLKTRIRGEIVLAGVIALLLFIETTGVLGGVYFESGRAESVQEESSLARKILWQAGIEIALDNPILGIGGDRFSSVSGQYSESVDPTLLEWEESQYWGYSTLGNEPVHNDFLYMWVSYGIVGLVGYAWLVFAIMRNFMASFRAAKKPFIRGLAIGLAAALVASIVNAFYHNLMITLPLVWILGGFSLAVAKLAAAQKTSGRLRQQT